MTLVPPLSIPLHLQCSVVHIDSGHAVVPGSLLADGVSSGTLRAIMPMGCSGKGLDGRSGGVPHLDVRDSQMPRQAERVHCGRSRPLRPPERVWQLRLAGVPTIPAQHPQHLRMQG